MIYQWVTITEDERRICTWVGRKRFTECAKRNANPGKGPSSQWLPEFHIRGAITEFAASIILNLYWRPSTHIQDKDVGGLVEVRSGTELHHRLIIKPEDIPKDPLAPWVLMIEQPGNRYGFAGWCYAAEADELPLLTDHGDPAHFVGQDRLYSLAALSDWIANQRINEPSPSLSVRPQSTSVSARC